MVIPILYEGDRNVCRTKAKAFSHKRYIYFILMRSLNRYVKTIYFDYLLICVAILGVSSTEEIRPPRSRSTERTSLERQSSQNLRLRTNARYI